MKIGFFGGCFNPPTIAHVELAKKAVNIVKLDKLIFIPMGNCYPKDHLLDIKDRYEMLKLAIGTEEKFQVSDMQFNQKEITYAIDTFKKIDEEYNCEKYFIMGYDNFLQMKNWKSSNEFKNYKFIVFERDGKVHNNKNVILIETNEFNNVSSSKLRNDIKENKCTAEFIKEDVLKYIQENKLYQ
ncbi:MAG: nicotinate (nicotinamide) nucleotide adenylyltransferase [Candidatus Scatovivens sp.]